MLAYLMVYVGSLALLTIVGNVVFRSYPEFTISQFDSSEKTETYEISRHPESGRKDVIC